jgi:hypothetical protein
MTETKEITRAAQELGADEDIPDSPRDNPEHLFWLEQGRKMLTDSVSLTVVRAAATSLMTGLGAMQAIYIGVLGFADFIPKEMKLPTKWFFAAPHLDDVEFPLYEDCRYCAGHVIITREIAEQAR